MRLNERLRGRSAAISVPLALVIILTGAAVRAEALPPDALAQANAEFHAMYRAAKARALADAGPVLLVEGDTLVLRNGSARTAVKFLPPGYTALKEASHVPLALFVLLHGAEGPLPDPTRKALVALASEVRSARTSLGDQAFPRHTLTRQEQVLEASAALAEVVTKRGAVAPGEVLAFARRMGLPRRGERGRRRRARTEGVARAG